MDVGLRAVNGIRTMLQVDRVWSEEADRGFRWWAFQTPQDILASTPWRDRRELSHVTVRTWVLSPPRDGRQSSESVLARMNDHATGGAFRQFLDGAIVHESAALAAADTVEWVTRALATMAIMSLTRAVAVAEAYAEELGSVPITSGHPKTGVRPWPDDMLNMPDQLIIPKGQEASAWDAAAPFAWAANTVNQGAGLALDTSGRDGLICEFGFGARATSFLVLRPTTERTEGMPPGMPPVAPDETYGHGLAAWLVLPLVETVAEAARLAAVLNTAEMTQWAAGPAAGSMHFGAWTVWDPMGRPTPAYRMFIPNVLAGAVSAENIAMHMWVRALNASRLLLPNEEPLDGPGLRALFQRRVEESRAGRAPN